MLYTVILYEISLEIWSIIACQHSSKLPASLERALLVPRSSLGPFVFSLEVRGLAILASGASTLVPFRISLAFAPQENHHHHTQISIITAALHHERTSSTQYGGQRNVCRIWSSSTTEN